MSCRCRCTALLNGQQRLPCHCCYWLFCQVFLEPPASLCTMALENLTPISCFDSHTFLNCFDDMAVPLPTLIFSRIYLCFELPFVYCCQCMLGTSVLRTTLHQHAAICGWGWGLSGLCCTNPIRLHFTISLGSI